jgi:hypothetical protein
MSVTSNRIRKTFYQEFDSLKKQMSHEMKVLPERSVWLAQGLWVYGIVDCLFIIIIYYCYLLLLLLLLFIVFIIYYYCYLLLIIVYLYDISFYYLLYYYYFYLYLYDISIIYYYYYFYYYYYYYLFISGLKCNWLRKRSRAVMPETKQHST